MKDKLRAEADMDEHRAFALMKSVNPVREQAAG
jgi:hypothetical protein